MKVTDLKTPFLYSCYSVLNLFVGCGVSSLQRLSAVTWCESLSSRLSQEFSWLGPRTVLICSYLPDYIYLITQLEKKVLANCTTIIFPHLGSPLRKNLLSCSKVQSRMALGENFPPTDRSRASFVIPSVIWPPFTCDRCSHTQVPLGIKTMKMSIISELIY